MEPYSGPPEQYMHAMHLHTCKQNPTVHETAINKTFKQTNKNDRMFFYSVKQQKKNSGV